LKWQNLMSNAEGPAAIEKEASAAVPRNVRRVWLALNALVSVFQRLPPKFGAILSFVTSNVVHQPQDHGLRLQRSLIAAILIPLVIVEVIVATVETTLWATLTRNPEIDSDAVSPGQAAVSRREACSLPCSPDVSDEVIEESGIGTFGKVFRCVDREGDGKEVAIKVVRNVKRYTESAEVEARILTLVNKADPANESHCVRFYSTFTHGEHMCMVFELLGPSVYDYLKRNRYKPLPLYCVQAFADQLCWAIAYLHALELTHTDLKPENLLLTPTQFVETSARTYTRQPRTVLAPKSTVMKRACACISLSKL
jgi:hypothetical protein